MDGILKSAARQLFQCTGGLYLVRIKNRTSARILMYHRFSDPTSLNAQCIYLKHRYKLLSMQELSECLQSERPLPPNAVIITVDDGYRDFLEIAFPIFSTYSIPVTVFLVTDFLDGHMWLWPDVVKYAFEHTPLTVAEVDIPHGRRLSLPLGSLVLRLRAAQAITEEAKTLPNTDRLLLLGHTMERLQVRLPREMPEHCQPLRWEEVRSLAQAGVEFGAHTRTHPILSKISTNQELQNEIAGSKKRIEEELDKPVLHFCYPNGQVPDISASAVATVRASGFRTAVTAEGGLNTMASDRFLLHRIAAGPGPDSYFRQCVAGFRVRAQR
jgi:peptidoglycan/xylan/chitin deacetylase (PgdA/CDA1 family)